MRTTTSAPHPEGRRLVAPGFLLERCSGTGIRPALPPSATARGRYGTIPRTLGAAPHVCGAIPDRSGAIPDTFGAARARRGIVPDVFGAVPHACGAVPHACGAIPHARGAIPGRARTAQDCPPEPAIAGFRLSTLFGPPVRPRVWFLLTTELHRVTRRRAR